MILDCMLYTAGVDAEVYPAKAAHQYRFFGLDYCNFFCSASSLIAAANMTLRERLWLRAKLALIVMHLMRWHEPRFLWLRIPRWR